MLFVFWRTKMPYSLEHKALSREKILKAAADLFCRYGFDSVSLTEVMRCADMTHGGFYAHFSSKTKLYVDAIRYAAKQSAIGKMEPDDFDQKTLISFIENYLSLGHIRQESAACPLAFLSTDVAHREPLVRESYEKTFFGMTDKITSVIEALVGKEQAREYAQYLVVNLVGAVSVARSLVNPKMQIDLLTNTKKQLLNWLDHIPLNTVSH